MFDNIVTYHVHRQAPLPPGDALAYQYILAGNGLFIRAETRFFEAILPIAPCTMRGLVPLRYHFRLKVPRIPARLLNTVLTDARRARWPDGSLNEVLYQFHHHGRTIQVKKPAQQATATSVLATIICDLHSHAICVPFSAGLMMTMSKRQKHMSSLASWTQSQRYGCGWACTATGNHCRLRPFSPVPAVSKTST